MVINPVNEDVIDLMEKYDSKDATLAHQKLVQLFIIGFRGFLEKRGLTHDISKLEEPEKSVFDEFTPKLKGSTYGSPEYQQFLQNMKPALDHHYLVNRHHPEFFENGIRGMNLVDIIEMFCDWCAATKRHDDGDIFKSIEINQERFGYSDDLKAIFKNTAEDLLS